jgi:phosphotransferase system enzyme I (PtsI)
VERVRDIVNECSRELVNRFSIKVDGVKIGSMIETPASVVNIDEIAHISDFINIGTNDLIQYTMAAGRENSSAAEYYEDGVKTVMRMIKSVVECAKRHNIECIVCGELSSETGGIEKLISAGIRNFSVSPYYIDKVREKIKEMMSHV